MKTEKVVLSFIAVLIGIIVTGVAFYLYQSAKSSSGENSAKKIVIAEEPSPTPEYSQLTIKTPEDGSVFSKKVIKVEGSTEEGSTVIIISPVDQEVLLPSGNGDFSATVDIDDDENIIEITSISPDGTKTTEIRTVTYSTEDF